MLVGIPVLSMQDAVLTVSPNISNLDCSPRRTPEVTGPESKPHRRFKSVVSEPSVYDNSVLPTSKIFWHSTESLAITSGVLQGLRSRFEIFGDTVNTASCMESIGIPTSIQIYQATTDLLIKAGKEIWVKPRDGCIIAKGKGQMQTYWLTMTDFHLSEGEDAFSFE